MRSSTRRRIRKRKVGKRRRITRRNVGRRRKRKVRRSRTTMTKRLRRKRYREGNLIYNMIPLPKVLFRLEVNF